MKNKLIKIGLLCMILGSMSAYAVPSLYLNFVETGKEVKSGEMNYYQVRGFAGDEIESKISNLSADVDLYVKVGAKPTKNTYDCRPYHSKTRDETCISKLLKDATVYIAVNGFKAGKYDIKATLVDTQPKVIDYEQDVFGITPRLKQRDYKIHANAGDVLKIRAYGMDADGDLFVNLGAKAKRGDATKYIASSYQSGSVDEEVTVEIDNETDVYIGLYADKSCIHTVNHHIKVTKTNAIEHVTVLDNGVADSGSVVQGKWKYYKIHASAGDTVKSILNGLDADADLYVKIGKKAGKHVFDCKSTNSGTVTDSCDVTLSSNTDVYMTVHGYKATDFTLRADVTQKLNSKLPKITKLKKRNTDNIIPRPTIGNPSIDNVYDTKIQMVHKSNTKIANYPKVQSWNKDMSLLFIGYRLYNSKTLEESSITKNKHGYNALCSPGVFFRWSNVSANKFYVLDTSRHIIEGTIEENNTVTCNTLANLKQQYEILQLGPNEGNLDKNDQYAIFVAKKYNDKNIYLVLFDMKNKKIVWKDKKIDNDKWENKNGEWQVSKLDWISVSQSGKYIVMNNYIHKPLYRYDINMKNRVALEYIGNNGERVSLGEHGDLGFDIHGNEVFVQNVSGHRSSKSGMYMFNLDNPIQLGQRLLKSPYGGGHVSCRNTDRPGWCYITRQTKGYMDVFALKLDASVPETVQYFSQTHIKEDIIYNNGKKGIYLETYGGVSPDGTKMIFNSHWDNVDQKKIDTFIAEAQ